MEKFSEFITEEAEIKYRLVVLTRKPEVSEKVKIFKTSDTIEKEAKSLGLDTYIVFLDGAYISIDEKHGRKIHNEDDEIGFSISSEDTVVIVRGGVNSKDIWKDLLSQLEKAGITCVNTRECIEICSDKYRTGLRLAEANLITPVTVLIPNANSSKIAFEKLDTTYPVILKTTSGTKGIGVLFVESERSLESMVQLLYKLDEDVSLILQTYIKTDYDVRVMVLNDEVIGAMRRNVIKGDFRSNYSRGANVTSFKLTEIETESCIRAAKIVNGTWVGVDFIPSKNRDKDGPFILEINSSPGTKGFIEATKINIIKELLILYKDKSNWWKNPTLCGVWETFEHDIFGKLIGKMDTGNSSETSVIHANKYEIAGKKIHWELNGKKMTSSLVKTKNIKLGGFRNREEIRPVIKLDLTFQNILYKNILFTLDNRGEKTPLLINRDFMKKTNLAVNPARKFILTNKLDN